MVANMGTNTQILTFKCTFFAIQMVILTRKSQFSKAKLLQLKPHPFICTRNFINKKVGKTKPTFIISVFKVEYCG